MIKKINILTIIIFIICLVIISLYIYGNYSGSCYYKDFKDYECDKNFCLIKKIKINIPELYLKKFFDIIDNNELKKRVEINNDIYIDYLFDCALPSKAGSTITTSNIRKTYPEIIDFYQNDLCNIISKNTNIKLKPTPIKYETSCCILVYEKKGDWINWHYDYNYYNGRFFTVLIPLTNKKTCTKFQYKIDNKINQVDLVDEYIIFEGNFLYHNASKLCENEIRCILSLQYVTDDSISDLNELRIKIKDIAYTGVF